MTPDQVYWLIIGGWSAATILLIALILVFIISRDFIGAIIANWQRKPLLLIFKRNGLCKLAVPTYKGGAYEIREGDNRQAFLRLTNEPAHRFYGTIIELAHEGGASIIPPSAAAAVHDTLSVQEDEIPESGNVMIPTDNRIFNILPLVSKLKSTSETLRAYVDTKLLEERETAAGGISGISPGTWIGIATVTIALCIGIAIVMR